MKNIYKQLNIKQKLMMLFSIQIIIPLVFVVLMIYQASSDIIKNKSIDYSVDILKMIQLRFDDFSDDVEMAVTDVLYDPMVYEVLENKGEYTDRASEPREDLYNILRKACLSHDEIQAIAVVSKREDYYTYDSNSGRVGIKDQLDYNAMHTLALDGAGDLVWYVDDEKAGRNIFAVRTIYSNDDYSEIGTMIILIKAEEIEAVYSDLSTEFMERIVLVNKDGEYVIGTDQVSESRLTQLNEVKDDGSSYFIDKETNTLVTYRDVDSPAWRIITEISMDKLNEDFRAYEIYIIVIFIATLILLAMMSIFMSMDIIKPINTLVAAMRQMKEDKIHEEIHVDRKDELGYLSESFNDMSREIDVLVNQVYKEQLTRKEAELKTLQAQINPHFLFNTLESINWMAMLNDVPEISEMVTALSKLMEAGIGKGMPMVPLGEELEFLDSYLTNMTNRYGDRLTFDNEIDGEILDRKVHKLLLQPILENANYHGIA